MGQRHAFWVIVTGTTPTAFRSRYREDLLPTLTQLQRTAPDAVLQWFDRGKLWASPEAARDALKSDRRQPPPRNRDWRPGGDHKDPRAKYKITRDEKRARFKKRRMPWRPPEPPQSGGDFFGDDGRSRRPPQPRDSRGDRRPPNRSGQGSRPTAGDGRQRSPGGWKGWKGKARDAGTRTAERGRSTKPPFKRDGDQPPFKRDGDRRYSTSPRGDWRGRPEEDERKKRQTSERPDRPWQDRPPRRDNRRRPPPRKKG